MQVGSLRRELDAGFEQRNGVFKIVLRHADASQQEDYVDIFWRELVGAHQQIERVHRLRLLEVNLGQQIQRFGGIGFQFQCAVQSYFGFRVFVARR